MILLVDFEKAFDSLSWDFIQSSLKKFNFGNNFIKWVNIFQKGSNSRIILNGHLSDAFALERGCRQGDPISPYLFILCSEFLTLAIKHDDHLRGITIKNNEHKCSQYADDTSIFLFASEENLRRCLQILHNFYIMSGLKININKTKVIRIGPIRETDRRYCRENDLEWVSEFTALGIQYNVLDLFKITELNIESKIESMKKLFQIWSCRNITPIGRICIAKSLIISKIIHILQSLPTPGEEYFKDLENKLINFIWKNKRHEISKTQICQSLKNGGLDMINLQTFDMCLKITWIRKMETGNPDWIEFPLTYKIDRLIKTDGTYHRFLAERVKNPFWKSVVLSYKKWYENVKELSNNVELRHIWGNPDVNVPFNNKLFTHNFIYLKDLFDHMGTPLSKIQIEAQIGSPIMLTTYFGIWKAIPKKWVNELKNKIKTYDVNQPQHIHLLLKDKKGTVNIRTAYSQQNNETPPSQEKWELKLAQINLNWEYLYTVPQNCKMNARAKYFQFQVLNGSLITNRKLFQFSIRNNDLCEYCGLLEDVTHLLLKCDRIKHIWIELERWLNTLRTNRVNMDDTSILLGNPQNELIINYVIIITKHEIYKSKWNRTGINLIKIKKILKSHMDLDIYLGTIRSCLPKMLGKWSTLYNNLRNLI